MLNVRIWVRNPYPLQDVEILKEMIYRAHPDRVHVEYCMLWDVHYIDVDRVSMTTARQIAATIKAVHLYQALIASRSDSRVHAEDVEVEILGSGDSPPVWAREAYGF